RPVILEIAERTFGVFHVDAVRPVEGHARGELLAHHAPADQQIAEDDVVAALADARAYAPGQEFGIALDIGDEIEHLLRRVGQEALLGVGGHRARAARERAWRRAPGAISRNPRRRNRRSASAA